MTPKQKAKRQGRRLSDTDKSFRSPVATIPQGAARRTTPHRQTQDYSGFLNELKAIEDNIGKIRAVAFENEGPLCPEVIRRQEERDQTVKMHGSGLTPVQRVELLQEARQDLIGLRPSDFRSPAVRNAHRHYSGRNIYGNLHVFGGPGPLNRHRSLSGGRRPRSIDQHSTNTSQSTSSSSDNTTISSMSPESAWLYRRPSGSKAAGVASRIQARPRSASSDHNLSRGRHSRRANMEWTAPSVSESAESSGNSLSASTGLFDDSLSSSSGSKGTGVAPRPRPSSNDSHSQFSPSSRSNMQHSATSMAGSPDSTASSQSANSRLFGDSVSTSSGSKVTGAAPQPRPSSSDSHSQVSSSSRSNMQHSAASMAGSADSTAASMAGSADSTVSSLSTNTGLMSGYSLSSSSGSKADVASNGNRTQDSSSTRSNIEPTAASFAGSAGSSIKSPMAGAFTEESEDEASLHPSQAPQAASPDGYSEGDDGYVFPDDDDEENGDVGPSFVDNRLEDEETVSKGGMQGGKSIHLDKSPRSAPEIGYDGDDDDDFPDKDTFVQELIAGPGDGGIPTDKATVSKAVEAEDNAADVDGAKSEKPPTFPPDGGYDADDDDDFPDEVTEENASCAKAVRLVDDETVSKEDFKDGDLDSVEGEEETPKIHIDIHFTVSREDQRLTEMGVFETMSDGEDCNNNNNNNNDDGDDDGGEDDDDDAPSAGTDKRKSEVWSPVKCSSNKPDENSGFSLATQRLERRVSSSGSVLSACSSFGNIPSPSRIATTLDSPTSHPHDAEKDRSPEGKGDTALKAADGEALLDMTPTVKSAPAMGTGRTEQPANRPLPPFPHSPMPVKMISFPEDSLSPGSAITTSPSTATLSSSASKPGSPDYSSPPTANALASTEHHVEPNDRSGTIIPKDKEAEKVPHAAPSDSFGVIARGSNGGSVTLLPAAPSCSPRSSHSLPDKLSTLSPLPSREAKESTLDGMYPAAQPSRSAMPPEEDDSSADKVNEVSTGSRERDNPPTESIAMSSPASDIDGAPQVDPVAQQPSETNANGEEKEVISDESPMDLEGGNTGVMHGTSSGTVADDDLPNDISDALAIHSPSKDAPGLGVKALAGMDDSESKFQSPSLDHHASAHREQSSNERVVRGDTLGLLLNGISTADALMAAVDPNGDTPDLEMESIDTPTTSAAVQEPNTTAFGRDEDAIKKDSMEINLNADARDGEADNFVQSAVEVVVDENEEENEPPAADLKGFLWQFMSW